MADESGASVKIKLQLRFIPNGLRKDGDNFILAGTVMLSAVPADDGAIDLVRWPESIAALFATEKDLLDRPLEHLSLSYSPSIKGECDAPSLTPSTLKVRPLHDNFPKAFVDSAPDLGEIWRKSLVPDPAQSVNAWSHLENVLSNLRTGQRVTPGSGFTCTGVKPKQPTLGADGQIVQPLSAAKDRECHAMIGTGLADAAVALEERRARDCLDTLKDHGALTRLPVVPKDISVSDSDIKLLTEEILERVKTDTSLDDRRKLLLLAQTFPVEIKTPPAPGSTGGDKGNDLALTQKFFDETLWTLALENNAIPEGTLYKDFLETYAGTLPEARQRWMLASRAGRYRARFDKLSDEMNAERTTAWNLFKNPAEDICSIGQTATNEQGEENDPLQAALNKAEYGRWPSYADQQDELSPVAAPQSRVAADAEAHIGQAYFGIEGNAGLARAFGLAMDVEARFGPEILNHPYGLLSVTSSLGGITTDRRTIHTRVKLYRVSEDPAGSAEKRPWGWPVSSEEVRDWRADCPLEAHRLSQFDGVLVMGGLPQAEGGKTLPRFDIATLNVNAAIEAERNWFDAVRSAEASPSLGRGQLGDLPIVGPDYQSDGLTLLNRSAVGDAVRKLRRIQQKLVDGVECDEVGETQSGEAYVIHDAEDVTNGYRLLIGAPFGKESLCVTPHESGDLDLPTEWRSLMGRSYRYGGSGDGGDLIEGLLQIAVGPAGSAERVALESAMQAIPTRDLPTGQTVQANDNDGTEREVVETIVDETFGQWDGSPGGVACAEVKESTDDVPDSNAFGRIVDVPTADDAGQPPHLRFGRPYRFGLQAVYSGGRAVPLADIPVEDPASTGVEGRLFYPSRALARDASSGDAVAVPYVRAMRHTRLGAPVVLVPSGHATRSNLPMGHDSSGKMIVRTMRGPGLDARNRSRARPAVAQRLILVPNLPQAVAAMHLGQSTGQGLLDQLPVSGGRPSGALADLNYDLKPESGFPVAETTTVRGPDNRRYLESRKLIAGDGPDDLSDDAEAATSVYWPRGWTRATAYYPDPAADRLILRLRRSEAGADVRAPLDGQPVSIPLSQDYPSMRRVLLSLRTTPGRRGPDTLPTQDNVMSDRGLRYINATRGGDISSNFWERDQAHEVAFDLLPGEQFALEMWFAPCPWRLAHDFALIQNLARMLVADGGDGQANGLIEPLVMGLKWHGLQDDHWSDLVTALREIEGSKEGYRYVGSGGETVPGTAILMKLAKAVHAAMLCHPVHEISAVREIELVHAVNRHSVAPVVRPVAPGIDPFPPARSEIGADTFAAQPLRAVRPGSLARPVAGYSDAAAISAGSKHLILKGSVQVDLERIDTLEILARTVSPDETVFDDPGRGRSLAHRLAGTWPTALGSDDGAAFREARHIFGFLLAPDGRAKLQEADIMLLRIDDIPPPTSGGAVTELDLEPYFLEPDDEDPADTPQAEALQAHAMGLVSRRHLFPDGKARRLEIRINGLARTAEKMETAARRLNYGDPWLGTDGVVHEVGELMDPQPLPRELLRNLSEPCQVIMPATVRPAELEPLSASHSIERTREELEGPAGTRVIRIVQKARTRLRFGRGWFSSGIDERLGIVTWPPVQAARDQAGLAQNKVKLRAMPGNDDRRPTLDPDICPTPPLGDPLIPGLEGREVALPNFEDSDLGPGGRFVTRRGMDPTRIPEAAVPEELSQTQILLSKEAFPDLWRHPADPNLAEYVPYALMPLGDAPQKAEGDSADESAPVDTLPPLACGLVTYTPRFDPIAEVWYVDVHLRPGSGFDEIVRFGLLRYQPHTRPGLRCSRPVAVQAQPLPDRTVEITLVEDVFEITVEGPVSRGRLHEKGNLEGVDFKKQAEDRDATVIRVTAFSSGASAIGSETREHITLDGGELKKKNDGHIVETRPDHSVLEVKPTTDRWIARIPLSAIKDQVLLTGLCFKIEEIDYRLPTHFEGRRGEMSVEDFYGTLKPSDWSERNAGLDVTEDVSVLIDAEIAMQD